MIRLFLIGSLILVGLNSCVYSFLKKSDAYKELNNQIYYEEVKSVNDSINILDIRTQGEYEKSHINGALNASLLNKEFKEIIQSYQLDHSKPTYIYCETQHRSHFAARIMIKKLGFTNIIDLDKGMMRWRKDSLPYIVPDSIAVK